MNRFVSVLRLVVIIHSWMIILRGFDIEKSWSECTTNPNDWNIFFCGYELGVNYSRHTVYNCKNKTPEVYDDCLTNTEGNDRLCPSHYCRRNPNYTTVRGCYAIYFCTPQRDFCGFDNLDQVKSVIINSISFKPHRKNRLHMLETAIERGMQKILFWCSDFNEINFSYF